MLWNKTHKRIKRIPKKTHTQIRVNLNKPIKKKDKMKPTENPKAFMIQI